MAGTRPKLEKAYIALLPPSANTTASLTSMARSATPSGVPGATDQLTFRFNPKDYAVQKSANWERKPTTGNEQAAIPEFTGANPKSLTLEVFLDASESPSGSVVKDIDLLFGCCSPTPQTMGQNKPKPPFVLFGWGTTMHFVACVKSVNAKYTLFRYDGTPIRATCSLTLEEIPTETPRQNPTSGGLAARRTHMVVDGDSLASIAYREYGTPTLWRALAEANDIDDPLRLRTGRNLLIPPATEAVAHA
jgi:nucleoid-associated protein YgaU